MDVLDGDITLSDVCAFLEANGDNGFAAELNALNGGPPVPKASLAPLLPDTPSPCGGGGNWNGDAASAAVALLGPVGAAPMMAPTCAAPSPSPTVLPGFLNVPPASAVGAADQQLVEIPDAEAAGAKGKSHICTWPGCGKGFNSRWSLERHAKNHNAPVAQLEDSDSFVERRLRERLKGVEVALERTRERQGAHEKQQEQADAELADARLQSEQQHAELRYLLRENALITAQIAQLTQHAGGAQLGDPMARALELQRLQAAGLGEAGALLLAAATNGVVVPPPPQAGALPPAPMAAASNGPAAALDMPVHGGDVGGAAPSVAEGGEGGG